jgi:enoyl-CoA hydratase/carnithine racemase
MRACAQLILRERIGPVMLIGMNRPHKRNAINSEMAQQLFEAFNEFETSKEAKVAVLHGCEGTFCAGGDLESISRNEEDLRDLINHLKHDSRAPLGPTRMTFSKPTIAAINGFAVAGGMELALMCDLRVMEASAIMGIYCRRFGVPLIDGGTVRLPALIGLSRALDLILTGRKITATEAFQMGLANRLVKDGTAVGQAVQLAREIAIFPEESMLADRRSAYYATFDAPTREAALEFEKQNSLPVMERESLAGAKRFVMGEGKGGKFENPHTDCSN